MHYVSIFSKNLTNTAVFFTLFDEKRKFFENFEKILKGCDENYIQRLKFLF